MPWLSRWRGRSGRARSGTDARAQRAAVEEHFAHFAGTRIGVEAYVEPATHVTTTTVVLIATDGEWTRRAVDSRDDAFALSQRLGLPAYDVNLTGYPRRMREWTARQRRTGRTD